MPQFSDVPQAESTLPPLVEVAPRFVTEDYIDECVREIFKDLLTVLHLNVKGGEKKAAEDFRADLKNLEKVRKIALRVTGNA